MRTGPVDIVVTHLTHMNNGHVCIAGLDPATGRHVRPVNRTGIMREFLDRPGGTIRIRSVLRFAWMTPVPSPPEVEDHFFHEEDADVVGELARADAWALLTQAAQDSPARLFGPEIGRRGRSLGLPEGHGIASLGVLRATWWEGPIADEYGKVRMTLMGDDGEPFRAPVTDLRLRREDDGTPDRALVAKAADRMAGREVLLSVGVGRAWAPADEPRVHWFQVNNIHVRPGEPA